MPDTPSSLRQRLAAALTPGWRTRFAPAPTGHLHLGHAVNAVYVWSIARAFGGHIVLRLEDHDRGRCRAEYEASILDDLDWLGLTPDEGTTASFRAGPSPLRQSDAGPRHADALQQLDARGLVYPCRCSRKDLARAQGTSHGEEIRYPGTCRDAPVDGASTFARRVRLDDVEESFDDLRLGPQVQRPAVQCGDVLVRDRHAQWTYQFAVVVDDLAHGVDVIIRGEDLLASTGRQQALARLLGRATPPRTLHHPLVRHPDGAKLSKSNRDTGLRDLRAAGWSPEAVLGRAAFLGGLVPDDAPLPAERLAELWR